MESGIHWSALDVTDGQQDLTGAERLRALRRAARGDLAGLWLCTLAELDEHTADGAEGADAGTAPETVDWSGIDGAGPAVRS